MIKGVPASQLFYYCPGCRKFHEVGPEHKPVNRKLCFHCGKLQGKKTKIIGNDTEGRSQICDSCLKLLKTYFY